MFSLDLIINSLEETIILFDKKTKIVFVNKTGEELFRKSSRDIIGKRLGRLLDEKETISPLIRKTIAEGRSFRGKSATIYIGRPINIDFNLSPLFLSSKIEGALLSIAVNINISEQGDLAFESIDYLLSSLAHEIKNPLGGIKGAAQLLRNMTHDVSIDDYVDLIIRETNRLNIILQDYLTVWKKPTFNPVNIHEVIEKALAIIKIPLQKSSISIKRLYDPSIPMVKGDEAKLLQVFLNIIKNAVEAMKKDGKITVSTYPSKELFREHGKIKRMAVATIKDTGRGISENDLQKIFIPFYTKKKHGSGIGLALSRKIIKDHGGVIKVKSQLSKGTSFHIYIPFEDNGKKNINN